VIGGGFGFPVFYSGLRNPCPKAEGRVTLEDDDYLILLGAQHGVRIRSIRNAGAK